ncbi:MAG: hypothetical protein JO363_16795, partial [Solirubrobacterales bacterium]|nr:hypothetical protein [Solirubrobacterales bacterium]
MNRALLTAGLALVGLGSFPTLARAHAVLLTSTPRWEAVLAASPRSIALAYSQDGVPHFARVAVVTPRGENLAGPP